jgi:GDSL-like Lipase/Acylhydrolase family
VTIWGAIRNFLLITLPVLLVLFCLTEVVFRVFLPACQLPVYCFDTRHGILHLDPDRTGIFTVGPKAELRNRWRTNNYGWNSVIDYVPHAGRHQNLIAVIGDSYIEAFSVNVNEALPALLRRWVGNQAAVYSFGISGAPLSQYLQMARYVDAVFQPAVLVINVVHNDFDESLASIRRKPTFLQIAGAGFKEIPPVPFAHSFLLRFCRLSATFRYLAINCHIERLFRADFWSPKPALAQYNANIDPQAVRKHRRTILLATEYLVGRFALENPDKKIIFLMDGPRFDIYGRNLQHSNVIWLNRLLQDVVLAHHLEFIDLTMPFADYFYEYNDFLNSQVDAHWNEAGHRVAARTLFQKLRETGVITGELPVDDRGAASNP